MRNKAKKNVPAQQTQKTSSKKQTSHTLPAQSQPTLPSPKKQAKNQKKLAKNIKQTATASPQKSAAQKKKVASVKADANLNNSTTVKNLPSARKSTPATGNVRSGARKSAPATGDARPIARKSAQASGGVATASRGKKASPPRGNSTAKRSAAKKELAVVIENNAISSEMNKSIPNKGSRNRGKGNRVDVSDYTSPQAHSERVTHNTRATDNINSLTRSTKTGKSITDIQMAPASKSPNKKNPKSQVDVHISNSPATKRGKQPTTAARKTVSASARKSPSSSPVKGRRKVKENTSSSPMQTSPEKVSKTPKKSTSKPKKTKKSSDEFMREKIKELEKQIRSLQNSQAKKEESERVEKKTESVRKMPSLSPVKKSTKASKKASPVRKASPSESPAKVSSVKPKVAQPASVQKVTASAKSEKVAQTPLSASKNQSAAKSSAKKAVQVSETPQSVTKNSAKPREKLFETPANVHTKSSVQSARENKFETPAVVPPKSTKSKDKNSASVAHDVRPASVRSQKRSPEVSVQKEFKDIVSNIEMINKKKEEEEKQLSQTIKPIAVKPKISVTEKQVAPKRLPAITQNYKQASPKISEDKQLFNQQYKKYINLHEVNKKKTNITSLEILLSIIEVAQHGQHYNIENSNRSVAFWKKVSELPVCANIFNSYRAETIRKYWRFINDRQVDKVLAVINRIKAFKEEYNVKLKSLISFINEFLKGKIENFEEALIKLLQDEYKSSFMLKKKRQRGGDIQVKKFIGINNPMEHIYGERFSDPNASQKSEENKERKNFFVLNEIIDALKEHFKKDTFTDANILNALILNSMNIPKTISFLKNPKNVNKKQIFSQAEDYIIQNLKNTDRYEQLIKEKSKEAVAEREKFLK